MANDPAPQSVMALPEKDTATTLCIEPKSVQSPLKKDHPQGTKRNCDAFADMDLENEDNHPQQKRRTGSPAGTLPTMNEATRRTKRSGNRSATQPRWHNQAYMLFLALRQHPDRCLSRPELIKAALALDEKISKERNLPRVFKGKTPMNSASASLTTNTDRYFIPFRPDGSRSMHFKLAYEPGNFQRAVQEYRKWERKLAEHDWPYCFGIPKNPPPVPTDSCIIQGQEDYKKKEETPTSAPAPPAKTPMTEFDEFMLSRNGNGNYHYDNMNGYSNNNQGNDTNDEIKDRMDMDETAGEDGSNTAAMKAVNELEQQQHEIKLEDLDLTNVPKSWMDILRVGNSTIPGAGQGLFATRKLPYNTPLGFYFGVPMTEDEYDSLKDGVGRASEYSIMYRRTVLDATDEEGQPFTDPKGEMFCPFHFMNETNENKANILFIEGAVVNQVICWTKRDIEPGEELFVWYGRDVDRHWAPQAGESNGNSNSKKMTTLPSTALS